MRHKYFSSVHIILCISLAFILINCKKRNENNTPTNVSDSTLNKNVVIIDSTKLILTTDTTQLNQGHLEYTAVGTATKINVNDIIVGATKGGYIMRVSSINQQANKMVIESTQATMEDVFNNSHFGFNTTMDSLKNGRLMSGYQFDVSGKTIFNDGVTNISLDKGIIDIDGSWNFGFNFKNAKLDSFELSNKNAKFNGQFIVNITASQAITLAEHTSTLGRIAKYNIFLVGNVPVVVYTEVELRCVFSAIIAATVKRILQVNTTNTADIAIKYSNSQWQNTFSNSSISSIAIGARSGNVNTEIKMAIVPYVSFRLYRVLGPYASVGLRELIKGNVASPALDWDFYAGAWVQTIVGARAGIFSKSWIDYSKEWNTDTIKYQTPYKIEKTSGDNQTGTSNQYLSLPIKVRVLDNGGASEANVPVYFNVTSGGGSVETSSILTDKDGYAQTRWKIAAKNVIQTVEAKVKMADGTLINGSPIEFAASANLTDSTFIDSRDGQVYPFRHIGNQVWMTKNLNYRLNNPVCNNCDIYGPLYYYAQALTVAPKGWHLPTATEWATLITFLGGKNVAGKVMKSTSGFLQDTVATNSSGFSAVGAGYLWSGDNKFYNTGFQGIYWSSTQVLSTPYASWSYYMLTNDATIYDNYRGNQDYFSVRCVRDN